MSSRRRLAPRIAVLLRAGYSTRQIYARLLRSGIHTTLGSVHAIASRIRSQTPPRSRRFERLAHISRTYQAHHA